ncbi:MAG: hypothetical protein NVSMB9_23200 [Isosphaeraceae bacterium]
MSALEATEARRQRGLAIAAICRIEQKNGQWIVPSQTGNGHYRVNLNPPSPFVPRCTCPDYEERGEPCKHVFAVEFVIRRESHGDGTETVTVMKRTIAERPTYRQDWPAYNKAQTNEKAKFQAILHDLCRGVPESPRKPGAGRKPMPMADLVFAAAFKVYSTISGRRFQTDLDAAVERGHLSRPIRYNTVFDGFENPSMTPILRSLIAESALPLKSIEEDFAVDSSGFSTSRFVKWFDHKYGKPRQEYDWVKCHLMCGVKTNIVTSVEIGERYAADCPQFVPLLNATARNFKIREVSADTAYSSYENAEAVAVRGGTPYIAYKTNTTAAKGGIFATMFHLYNLNRDAFLAHYHKRSNVETTFSMIKAKFGDHLRSKTDTAMVNEALCKILAHNVCCLIQSTYELDVAIQFWGKEAESECECLESTASPPEAWDWV